MQGSLLIDLLPEQPIVISRSFVLNHLIDTAQREAVLEVVLGPPDDFIHHLVVTIIQRRLREFVEIARIVLIRVPGDEAPDQEVAMLPHTAVGLVNQVHHLVIAGKLIAVVRIL